MGTALLALLPALLPLYAQQAKPSCDRCSASYIGRVGGLALALGVGSWCIYMDVMGGTRTYVSGAVASFVCAVLLVIYGFWFHRKMKRLRIYS